MKLWQKIYLFSLLLLMFTLNISGITLIQRAHNNLLEKEVEKCINEQKFISSGFRINSIVLERAYPYYNEDIDESISTIINEYMSYVSNEDKNHGYIEVLDLQNKVIYRSKEVPILDRRDELENLSFGEINYIIRGLDNRQYIFVSSLANIRNTPVKISYIKDISSIYSEKMNYYNFFIKLDILISLIFTIFMFFISRLLTKPIKPLIDSTKKIAEGQYSERIKIRSKDEFNVLSNNFNIMAQTIEDKMKELESSNIEKEVFINNLTHELKTPLTSIIGYANLIRTSKYDEKIFFEAADYIYKEGKRVEQMAFKMMDLIYAKSENIKFKPEKIMSIIDEAKRSLLIKLKDKNIDLIVEGQDSVINVDKDLIKILICNLVENAINASKNNSKIYIRVSNLENKISISIIDLGVGIVEENVNKIWQPFFVVDKSRCRKNNGAGIGLSICKKIAEVHDADIRIDSELNKGTKISINFKKYY